MKLKIQMIPQTMYGKNLRSVLAPQRWQQISRLVRNNSGLRCEICGKGVDSITELDAHEVWKFRTITKKNGKTTRVQKLKKIQAVCGKCHGAMHIGYAKHAGFYDEAVDWFLRVNRCGFLKFRKAEEKAYRKFLTRSRYKWKLDVNKKYLEKLLQEPL